MLIAIFFIFGISDLIGKTVCHHRVKLSILILMCYLMVSLIDLFWLFEIENIPLHRSDPTEYYEKIKDVSFFEIFTLESSNTFYLIINWIINCFWDNPYWLSIWTKIDNCLIAVFIYLLLTYKIKNVTKFDYILLFNPYMFLTINRNVRDLYIILFVLVILLGFKIIKNREISNYWIAIAMICLSITRVVLFGPLMVVWIWKKWNTFGRMAKIIAILSGVIVIVGSGAIMFQSMINQMISAMEFIGEDVEDFAPLIAGDFTPISLVHLFFRLIKASIVFVFTPNPINFLNTWIETSNEIGASNIYTGFDNILIFLGSIYHYMFIIPYVLYAVFNYKRLSMPFMIFTFLFSFLYIVSYLGQTDIRNHNTAIFFFICSLMFSPYAIKLKLRNYLFSILLCLGIGKG